MEEPTLAKYSLKEFAIMIGSVTKEPFLSIIVISFKLLIPFQIADVFFYLPQKKFLYYLILLSLFNLVTSFLINLY